MLERAGHNNLSTLLDYYENIGWISENVSRRMLELARAEKRYKGTSWTLSAKEHRVSMLFIKKLMGEKIDDPLLKDQGERKAEPVYLKKGEMRPRAGYMEAQRRESDRMKVLIHRREVTIKNLERELEDKDLEVRRLEKKITSLEDRIAKYSTEDRKNKIYRKVLGENIKLRKG